MTVQQWAEQYRQHKDRADRVSRMILDRAKQACANAGLSADLIGIHPHNAMCAYRAGQPWEGVDYGQVRLCLHLLEKRWEPSRILDQWHRKAWERVARS